MPRITQVKDIALGDLVIGKGQVRLRDVGKEVDELAASIAKVGLLEPIVVAPLPEGKYEIITGQRRFLAHQQLGVDSISAGILDGSVDELTAKVLSVTENLVRRDLSSKDLIDVCTELFRRYGSLRAVAEETGLPYNKVAQYVKFDQLVEELKELVTQGSVPLQTALKAQKAASFGGDINAEEAVELAHEMAAMSGAQQKKIVEEREVNPQRPVDEVIEHAKGGGKITQILIELTSNTHSALRQYADDSEATIGDAARVLIEGALNTEGYAE